MLRLPYCICKGGLMEQKMKKAGLIMSVLMALVMSFFMSLIGNLSSGKFSLPIFLITLLISFIVSLAIGLAVPMPRITASIAKKMKGSKAVPFVDAFVSDLIYTPLMTLVMVFSVRRLVPVMSGQPFEKLGFPPFIIMFLKSLLLCFAAGYILILVFTPLIKKAAFKGIRMSPDGRPPKQN